MIDTIKVIDGKDYNYPLSISIIPTKSKRQK